MSLLPSQATANQHAAYFRARAQNDSGSDATCTSKRLRYIKVEAMEIPYSRNREDLSNNARPEYAEIPRFVCWRFPATWRGPRMDLGNLKYCTIRKTSASSSATSWRWKRFRVNLRHTIVCSPYIQVMLTQRRCVPRISPSMRFPKYIIEESIQRKSSSAAFFCCTFSLSLQVYFPKALTVVARMRATIKSGGRTSAISTCSCTLWSTTKTSLALLGKNIPTVHSAVNLLRWRVWL